MGCELKVFREGNHLHAALSFSERKKIDTHICLFEFYISMCQYQRQISSSRKPHIKHARRTWNLAKIAEDTGNVTSDLLLDNGNTKNSLNFSPYIDFFFISSLTSSDLPAVPSCFPPFGSLISLLSTAFVFLGVLGMFLHSDSPSLLFCLLILPRLQFCKKPIKKEVFFLRIAIIYVSILLYHW